MAAGLSARNSLRRSQGRLLDQGEFLVIISPKQTRTNRAGGKHRMVKKSQHGLCTGMHSGQRLASR